MMGTMRIFPCHEAARTLWCEVRHLSYIPLIICIIEPDVAVQVLAMAVIMLCYGTDSCVVNRVTAQMDTHAARDVTATTGQN